MQDHGKAGSAMTDRQYLWRASKRGHRVHIENPETGRAYCQAEKCGGGRPFDGRGEEVPAGRRVCGNCIGLAEQDKTDYREPDLRVRMGERLAEVEPELFASTVAPKPQEHKRPTRPVSRPKGRKPKRSNVKYARPFNDDLPPWL